MYGKLVYDSLMDAFLCEFPVRGKSGRMQICGKWCKDLVRHITRHHRITAREYKKMLGLNMNESLMSEETKAKLRKANLKYKTFKNLEAGKKYRLKKGKTTIQNYPRSEQTKKRLRTLRQDVAKGKK